MSSTATRPLLALRGIGIRAGVRRLVEDLDLEIRAGETWCVLGPNGSGKSTLLHVMAGLRAPESGTVELFGRPYAEWHPRAAARTRGLLLQGRSDAFSASVLETVLVGRHPHVGRFGWEGEEDRRIAADAIARMDLAAAVDRDVLTLSGGERQRAALAALLAQDPLLFLLDEPTAHLDLAHQATLFEHLRELTRTAGRSVVFATHDCNLAARFATHALLVCGEGRTRAGKVADVLQAQTLSELFGFPLAWLRSEGAEGFVPRW